jgi:hypothetical protein
MGLFEELVEVYEPTISVELLPALPPQNGSHGEPALVVEVAVLSDPERKKLRARCLVWDRRTNRPTGETDWDKFGAELAMKSIRGWSGLTVGNLKRVMPTGRIRNEQEASERYPDGLPFDENLLKALVTYAPRYFVVAITEALNEAEREQASTGQGLQGVLRKNSEHGSGYGWD